MNISNVLKHNVYEYFLTMCTAWVYIILQGVFSVNVYENIQVFFGVPFRWSIANFQLTLLAMGKPYNATCILLFVHSCLEFTPVIGVFKLRGHLLIKVTNYTITFSKFCNSTLCFVEALFLIASGRPWPFLSFFD